MRKNLETRCEPGVRDQVWPQVGGVAIHVLRPFVRSFFVDLEYQNGLMHLDVVRGKVRVILVAANRHSQVGTRGYSQCRSELFQQHSADFCRLLEVGIVCNCGGDLWQSQQRLARNILLSSSTADWFAINLQIERGPALLPQREPGGLLFAARARWKTYNRSGRAKGAKQQQCPATPGSAPYFKHGTS
jgi:hypothetical protein